MPDSLGPRAGVVASARRLGRRQGRLAAGAFVADGPQSVREALATGHVRYLLLGPGARLSHGDLVTEARSDGVAVHDVTESALRSVTDTVTPQGIIAVCGLLDRPWEALFGAAPTLMAMLLEDRDPGNVGTIVRTAHAAGADGLVTSPRTVDLHGAKAVRATAGSIFHLPVAQGAPPDKVVSRARQAGMRVLAADGGGRSRLPDLAAQGGLAGPTLWLFGNEAHGLTEEQRDLADDTVRIPLYGAAESLNLAVAASLCLYASAFSHEPISNESAGSGL